MLLPIKPICDAKKARRDGTSIVFIQYCYSSQNRTLIDTGIAIPPKYWIAKTQTVAGTLPIEYGVAETLNEQLCAAFRRVEDLIRLAEKEQVESKGMFVKRAFEADVAVSQLKGTKSTIAGLSHTGHTQSFFFEQMDQFIVSKQNRVTPATVTIRKALKRYLQAFEVYRKEEITFECIDYTFYEAFIDYLTFQHVHERRKELIVGLKVNTIGKIIKKFRSFIKDRAKRKVITSVDLSEFIVPEEETDAIYLSYEEVEKIYTTDLSQYPHLVEYRNLFVLACLTGLRFSDFSVLKPEDLRNNRLYKKQNKSDNWVVVPLRQTAKDIFTEQFKDKIPALTNSEFNRHIKTVGKLAGISIPITFSYKKGSQTFVETREKYDWITTHTARRSFCTCEFLAGTPVKLIMKISGHKNEKDFYRYIRITPEEAAGKIERLWLERGH